MAGRTPLALALLSTACLACATSGEGSFTGSALSAGPMTASGSTGGDSSSSSSSNGSSDSEGGSDSDSKGSTGSETGTTSTGSTTNASTTDDTSTTGLDCDDGLGNLCGNPYDLGSLAEGETAMSQTSTIITAGVADWFQVSFPAINRPGGGTPSISFVQNDDDAFRFDVFSDMACGGTPASCGEGGESNQATNLLEYTYTDDQPDCCSPPDDSMVSWPGTVFVRVFRIDEGETCAAYQLILER